jgi:phospholipase/carboxylesterase
MTAVLAQRPHVWLPGSGTTPLLLLHGTGGDEHDLLPLRDLIAPDAPVLSVRGAVLENGMPRFFRRMAEGVFDEDDIVRRVDELAELLAEAETEYGVAPGAWTAVGFSNGANIASAMMLLRPEALSAAALLAAMVPFAAEPETRDLTGKRVLVSNGARDPMATASHTARLVDWFGRRDAEVTLADHDGGHQLDQRTLPAIARWVTAG